MSNRAIVQVEIPAADQASSARFYTEMFGWQLEHMGEPFNYTSGMAGNTGIGINKVGENAKVGDVRVYISSDDIEADLKKIESLGGKTIMGNMAVGDFGWMAIFQDPAGNHVGLWKNNPQMNNGASS